MELDDLKKKAAMALAGGDRVLQRTDIIFMFHLEEVEELETILLDRIQDESLPRDNQRRVLKILKYVQENLLIMRSVM